MEQDNDAKRQSDRTITTNSGLTAWVELIDGPWALVACGPCGVRPRRVSGHLAAAFQKRGERC